MSELVSVIVPVYDVEAYLGRCVESILGQTHDAVEVILVDDGSPDACGPMCDAFALRDDRVRVIHKPNGGLSDARNAGLAVATGEFVTFVDSDDWVHPEYVEQLRSLLVRHGADVAVCGFVRTDTEEVPDRHTPEVERCGSSHETMALLVGSLHTNLTVAWGKLYRAALFTEVRFPVGRLHEDEFTTYRVLHAAKKTAITTARLYYYWQRDMSIMGAGFSVRRGLDAIAAYRERAAFLESAGLADVSAAAHAQLFRKYLQFYRWLDAGTESPLRQQLLAEMRELARRMRGMDQGWLFRVSSELYVTFPRLADPAFSAYERVRGRTGTPRQPAARG